MRSPRRLRKAGLVGAAAWLLLLTSATLAAVAPPPGPPYPDAVTGQRVYDYAGLFSPGAISSAEATIKAAPEAVSRQSPTWVAEVRS